MEREERRRWGRKEREVEDSGGGKDKRKVTGTRTRGKRRRGKEGCLRGGAERKSWDGGMKV